jgi:hypothetical protein
MQEVTCPVDAMPVAAKNFDDSSYGARIAFGSRPLTQNVGL